MLLVAQALAKRPGPGVGPLDSNGRVPVGGDLRDAQRNQYIELLPVARFAFGARQHKLESSFKIADGLRVSVAHGCVTPGLTPMLNCGLSQSCHFRMLGD